MSLSDVLPIIAGLAGLVAGLAALVKSRSESRKSEADAGHVVVDAAGDAVVLVEKAYEIRLAQIERDISNIKAEREVDRMTIISLNRQMGDLRQALEAGSHQIQLLIGRVDELLCILRDHKIPLPPWVDLGTG